jgi:hypothetical protein
MATYVTQIKDGYQIVLDKHVLLKENLEVGDYVEVTVYRIEKRPKSESGSPYSQ